MKVVFPIGQKQAYVDRIREFVCEAVEFLQREAPYIQEHLAPGEENPMVRRSALLLGFLRAAERGEERPVRRLTIEEAHPDLLEAISVAARVADDEESPLVRELYQALCGGGPS